jgi:hypothetical protein
MSHARPMSRSARLHADWIRMLQPDGLVVSVAVLEELGLYVAQPLDVQQALRACTEGDRLPDLATLLHGILGWKAARFVPAEALQPPLRLDLPDLGLSISPTGAGLSAKGERRIVVQWVEADLDATPAGDPWPATHTERFERLLSRCGPPVGLIASPTHIRLCHAPAGEAPGRLTWPVSALREADGRLLLDALLMLLGTERIFGARAGQGLAEVLKASRERQEQVTEQLAAQVEEALRLLLAGWDAAHQRSGRLLLEGVSDDTLMDGLSTVLLRLVFLLYAEDYGLLPLAHPVYASAYSVSGLGESLAADAVTHAEAQTRRFSAWPRLISLFRLVWSGGGHGDLDLPPRQGDLFHPDRYPFLEGRPPISSHSTDRVRVPPVDDATLHAALGRLLYLDGQRISYRNLEVEQLGSVYEALMGFEVRRAESEAVALKGGAFVELGALAEADHPFLHLEAVTGERNANLRKRAPGLASFVATGDHAADHVRLRVALEPLLDPRRPGVLAGRHYLQPGAGRRSSGSHYTPRSLSEPLVRHTLGGLLGEAPSAEQVLGLRICDPAMGSGAFLAEACRQLADALVRAWAREGGGPATAGRDPNLLARRLVAERCLYGVDKNPRAVQLARMSLWLITSAADLPFTFVDHALREGDALVGLGPGQMAAFDLVPGPQVGAQEPFFRAAMESAARARAQITAQQQKMLFARDEFIQRKGWLAHADDETWDERHLGDLLVACAWAGGSTKAQRERVEHWRARVWAWYPNPDHTPLPAEGEALLAALPMRPFHWWLEYPEIFVGKRKGFDAVVGNPPFGGKNLITAENGAPYIGLLQRFWPHAHGNADLSAYFFLRAEQLLRPGGHFGLVASNTIKQGDTLDTGLRHLLNERGITLTRAVTDLPWPLKGAAVVVDVVQGTRGKWSGGCELNGEAVESIHSSLGAGDELPEPTTLAANNDKCFQGSKIYGQGFVLTPEEADRLVVSNPGNTQIIRPYIGGSELNSNVPPTPTDFIPPDRFVINFGERSELEARGWPALMEIVERLVLPERQQNNREGYRRYWWRFGEWRPGLNAALTNINQCMASSIHAKHLLISFQPSDVVFSHALVVFALTAFADFAVLQSRVHEHWARLLGSSMKTDLRYTPSSCFETFPFPRPTAAQRLHLEATGEALHRERQTLMVALQVGMTALWNRLLDPHEDDPRVLQLRETREAMDRAVLAAYGWSDVEPDDKDEINRRLRKLNARRAAEEAAAAAGTHSPNTRKART